MLELTLCCTVPWVLANAIMLCVHHYCIIQFHYPKINLFATCSFQFLFPPKPLATPDCFTVSIVLTFPKCHIVGFK